MKPLIKFIAAAALLTPSVAAAQGIGSADSVAISTTPLLKAINYEAEALVGFGSGTFAPYYIAANRHGLITQKTNTLLRLGASKIMAEDRRFDFGFGVEVLTGYASSTDYARFVPDADGSGTMTYHSCHPAAIWLQQLYGEVKYRSLFLNVGMKERTSALLNFELSSGDLTESGNARPIPQVRAGFIDFQDIPLTNGWVQIQGEISYGKFADNGWMKDHYNYYNWHINLGGLYTYKRCYFRTKPSQPFSLTLGMQMSGLFGGTTSFYNKGKLSYTEKCPQSVSTFFKMFLPVRGKGSDYYDGNTLGSWDIVARYRLPQGAQLKAYVEKPWEDGSGIGWQNGFDGLWGIEYVAADPDAIVGGAVVEYLDFTNQSGPLHWYPGDNPGTSLNSHVNGGDEYYNNYLSNSYMNYGMSLGTPMLRSPLYNVDGYMAYVDNRVRGFHAGISGTVIPGLRYRLLGSYRKGYGDGRIPTFSTRHTTSAMLEGAYSLPRVKGLAVKAQIAIDRGNMYGNTFGALISVSYNGVLNL